MNAIILTGAQDLADRFLDISSGLSGETISSLILIGIICLLCFYIAIRARFANPLKKPWGILFLAEVGVTFFDGLVESLMGKKYRGFGGFIMAIAVYLFLAFIWGLTGLPSPVVYLLELILDLGRSYEEVRVILAEVSYALNTLQGTAGLETEVMRDLTDTDG